MIRTLLWLAGGVLLGGIVHILVILTLPALAEETVWDRIQALGARERVLVLSQPLPGAPNPFGLDPVLAYGLCEIDLARGPGFMSGTMPDAFWSVAVYASDGTVLYSTTNRDGIGRTLELGIFNAAQTRQLAQQELDIEEGLLVVESRVNALFVLLRLAPPHPAIRPRFEAALAEIACGTMG